MATQDEIWNAPFTQEHMQRATEYAVTEVRRNLSSAFAQEKVDSPLEAAFATWWHAYALANSYDFELQTQREVVVDRQTFRLDFVIEPHYTDRLFFARAEERHLVIPKIGVELDGHDFHERTKEQVTRRDARDRILTAAGWTVLHFSGSEFHRDPIACLYSVASTAAAAFEDLRERLWRSEHDYPRPDSE